MRAAASHLDRRIDAEMIRQALRARGGFRLRALGGSMMPVIRHGEEIFIEPILPPEARPGDVLFIATADGRFLGHRFLRTLTTADGITFLLTKGDTLPQIDPPHPPASLLGLVTAVGRQGRILRLGRGSGPRWIARASRASAFAAAPLLFLSRRALGERSLALLPAIRYATCGPVFLLGWLLQRGRPVAQGEGPPPGGRQTFEKPDRPAGGSDPGSHCSVCAPEDARRPSPPPEPGNGGLA